MKCYTKTFFSYPVLNITCNIFFPEILGKQTRINTRNSEVSENFTSFLILMFGNSFFFLFLIEKLAEAQRRFATLQNELQSSLDAQKESTGSTLRQRRKPVFHLSHEERVQHRNIKDLKLAFSEFYLSLILLQNYQVLQFLSWRMESSNN